jgi:hypothetical protein
LDFEYIRALEIYTRRFRRNFDMGKFIQGDLGGIYTSLGSSRILEKYYMPCNAMQS